jgi:hypothetical protein
VALADHEGCAVQDLVVKLHLFGETAQAVAIRFDLVSAEGAVHHRDIDADPAPADPELLEHHKIGSSRVIPEMRAQ